MALTAASSVNTTLHLIVHDDCLYNSRKDGVPQVDLDNILIQFFKEEQLQQLLGLGIGPHCYFGAG